MSLRITDFNADKMRNLAKMLARSRASHGLSPYSRTPVPQSRTHFIRHYSSKSGQTAAPSALPHLNPASHEVHQVSVSAKIATHRMALAVGHIRFSSHQTLNAVRSHLLKKGDVLAVARVGAIQAVKETARSVVLAHAGIGVEGCVVDVVDVDAESPCTDTPANLLSEKPLRGKRPEYNEGILDQAKQLSEPIGQFGGIRLAVQVETTAKTGVEMEALAGIMGAALNVVDMVKAVDKGVSIEEVKVVGKKGGRSGGWGIWAGSGRDGEEILK